MKKICTLLFLLFLLFSSNIAIARTPTGFHEGPYFMLMGGVLNYTADDNARTGASVGRDYEPCFGFNFGWNLKDYIAPELEVRYATNKNSGNREHVVNVNLNAVYTLLIDPLTRSKNVKVLPFIQAGPMVQFAAIPGDPLSSDKTIPSWGPGLSIGTGLKILFLKYGYAGLMMQTDFLSLPTKKQNILGVDTVIVKGGWDVQLDFLAMFGAHF